MIWDEVESSVEVQIRITRTGVVDLGEDEHKRYDLSKFIAKHEALDSREVIVIVEGQDLPYSIELEELEASILWCTDACSIGCA